MKCAWITLSVALCFSLTAVASAEDEAGFQAIFDGENLDGWDGNPKFWSAKDGAIVGQTTEENPTQGNTFLIWRQGTVDDFILRLQYRIDGGNSGIQYRSKEMDKWVIGGYQGDFEAGETYSGILYEERGRGILGLRGTKVTIKPDGAKAEEKIADSAELQKLLKEKDWNDYEIVAQGNHLTHKINGIMMSQCIDEQVDKRSMSGLVGLQLHQGKPMTVQFKNIRLKRMRMADGRKKIVMVAGAPSHGIGEHEYNAGTRLLKKCLDRQPNVVTTVYSNGWPHDPTAFDNADTILLYMNGGAKHPVIHRNRLTEIDQLMSKGVGLCCAHYAVEVPKEKGGPDLIKWIGGYYETDYSINPTWMAEFKTLPTHAVTSGVEPFTIRDEWYYNIRFPEGQTNVKPILEAIPPDGTRGTAAAKQHPGRSEVLAWTVERPDGGRGFGFTGGHFHANWANPNFRKLVLNALLWTAKADVPKTGVDIQVVPEEMQANLDKKERRKG